MAFTDSDPFEGGLTLQGVWLHDPLDAEETVHSYLYGAGRTASLGTLEAGQLYAGRTFQVVDYGEHQEEAVQVSVQVPHGTDWAATLASLREFAEARRTVCYRDNRGRLFYGTLVGYDERDEAWGTLVGFTINRVHFSIEAITVSI